VEDYLKNRTLDLSRFEKLLSTTGVAGGDLLANQCVNLVDSANSEHEALGRFCREAGAIRPLARSSERAVHGIKARNSEQRIAFDLLLDDSIQIVTLVGKAGTGKTLLAIAAGMQKVATERAYTKLVVARPIMPLGKELGFLPGAVGEKLRPWMAPVYDNLELILKSQDASRRSGPSDSNEGDAKGRRRKRPPSPSEHTNRVMASGLLEVEPLTYIRGRSLPHQFLVIDEAQNLTHHEVKTIITRAGEGTKIVLTGDPYQIDNPFLDSATSGLTIAVERFKGQDVAGHVTLVQGERSELAELGSDLL
jgi:PhoH-like ATPase